jgi:lauroyl/myristoyl acyltransferase
MAARPKTEELFEAFMVQLLRRLPITWASWLGGEIGARRGRAALKGTGLWVQRLRRNIAQFSGITDPDELDRRVIGFTGRIGQQYAEYTHLQRLYASGRVEVVGGEHLDVAGRPFILVSCHVANWEYVCALAYKSADWTALYLPLGRGIRQKSVLDARKAWPGVGFIPASPSAARQLDRTLQQGKGLLIYIDEEKKGYVWGPSLGRALPYAGNRWLAARLAVRHDVNIIPVFVEYLGLAKYRVVVQPALERPAGMAGEALARHLADQIDARAEAWIRPRIESWYWLPYFEPDAPCPIERPATTSAKPDAVGA